MKHNIILSISVLLTVVGMSSCSGDVLENEDCLDTGKIAMEFSFSHPSQSRATETSFESGDVVGVFVAEKDAPLQIAGNTVNNERLTFNGSDWKSNRTLYWNEGNYDVYAYYPHLASISSITDLPFEVKTDQRDSDSGMSGYEASDFLFATAKNVSASESPVSLQFSHIMSKITVRLIKGEDFVGEIPSDATVYIHNTVTESSIDMVAGVVTKALRGNRNSITARKVSPTNYSAIIIPQRLDNRVPLVEVVMNGVSFLYEGKFVFKPGIHHIVNFVVDKNPDEIKIEIGGEIPAWN